MVKFNFNWRHEIKNFDNQLRTFEQKAGRTLVNQMQRLVIAVLIGLPSLASAASEMTNPSNPALAALKDIKTPVDIGFWPLAPGYYISAMLILAVIALAAFNLHRHQKRYKVLSNGIIMLASVPLNTPNYAFEVNSILKRICMSYQPRQGIAKLNDEAWLSWMSQCIPANKQDSIDLTQLNTLLKQRYQSSSLTAEHATKLQQVCLQWLKLAGPKLTQPNIIPVSHKSKTPKQNAESLDAAANAKPLDVNQQETY